MIPKIIHYCWFGGKALPSDAKKYIEGWKKLCPDFEIREWNESNLDFSECRYAKEAYASKKWAFVSDYARLKVLNLYGGIYLDTDVELLKSPLQLMEECEKAGLQGYMGIERAEEGNVNPGLGLASEAGSPLIRELIEDYKQSSFVSTDGTRNQTTIVEYTTETLKKHGLSGKNENQDIAGFRILRQEYLNPVDMSTGKINKTDNTVSIHHFASSWVDGYSKLRGRIYRGIYRIFGKKAANRAQKLLGRNKEKK